jgi:hypothetical protein
MNSYPCNRPWTPIGLWDVEAPKLFVQCAHRWRWGRHPYASAAIYNSGRFLVLISVRGSQSHGLVRLEGLGKFKKSNGLPGIKTTTFRRGEHTYQWILLHWRPEVSIGHFSTEQKNYRYVKKAEHTSETFVTGRCTEKLQGTSWESNSVLVM